MMTHITYTDRAVMLPGMTDGLNSWMPLNNDQRHGWACIACGRNAHSMRPVGTCDDGQVFLCVGLSDPGADPAEVVVDCYALWASDVPATEG